MHGLIVIFLGVFSWSEDRRSDYITIYPRDTCVFEVRFSNTQTLGNGSLIRVSCQHCKRPCAHSVSTEKTISLSTSHQHRRLPAHILRKGLCREPQLPLAER